MIDILLPTATLLAALGCGMNAGLFFIFSNTVMPAFAREPAPNSMAAMQAINRVIINPFFLILFLGTAVLCLFLSIAAVVTPTVPGRPLLLAGCAVYLIGGLLVTAFGNVPLNNALDRHDAAAPDAEPAWTAYLKPWTRWNHVRTLACLSAALLLTLAYGQG